MNDLTPATIGLFGVIVGSIISIFSNLILFLIRENIESKKEKHVHNTNCKRAVRLVLSDLQDIIITIKLYSKGGQQILVKPMSLESWEKHKDTLAVILSDEEWHDVSKAFASLAELKIRVLSQDLSDVSGAFAQATMRLLISSLEKGTNALNKVDKQIPYARYTK